MAGHQVTGQPRGVDDAANVLIEGYLTAIAARLSGPRRARTAAISELRDGLHDALDAHRRHGLDDLQAAEAAVTESGTVAVVAAAYRPVLADIHARRTSQALLATGPLIGVLWLLTLVPGQPPDALLPTVPLLGGIVAAGALAGLITLASTGRGARWLPDIPGLPQLAATLACLAATLVDVTILTVAASRILTTPAAAPWVIAIAAAAASTSRLVYSQRAAHVHLRNQRGIRKTNY